MKSDFLFSPISLKRVSLLRFLTSVMVIVSLYYRDVLPRRSPFPDAFNDHVFFTDLYRYLLTVCLVIFGLGYKTRAMGAIVIILFFPLIYCESLRQSRQVLFMTLCAVSFYPSYRITQLFRNQSDDEKRSSMVPIWPILLVQIQLSLLYLINALYKTSGSYLSGEVNKSLSKLPHFKVDLTHGLPLGDWLIPISILSILTVITEYCLAFGFWFRRTLWPTVIVGVLFHASLTFVLTIGMLDYVSCFLYLFFIVPLVGVKASEKAVMFESQGE